GSSRSSNRRSPVRTMARATVFDMTSTTFTRPLARKMRAAIDANGLPGDSSGGLAAEKKRRLNLILHGGDAARRHFLRFLLEIRQTSHTDIRFSRGRPRHNEVAVDAPRA